MNRQQLKTTDGTCYRIEGNLALQPVVVLIHGVGLDQGMWQSWRRLLGDRYCVVSYDLLGHGGSNNPAGPRSFDDFTGQLERLANHLKLIHWHLVGFSLGALVALCCCAQNRPAQLASLTLLHPVFNRSREQLAAVAERYETTRNQGAMATVEIAINRWFSADWIAAHPDQVESIRHTFRQHTGDGYLKAYRLFCMADEELADINLDGIECPGLVITGGEDTGSTADMARQLSGKLQATSIINPGQRHMAPVEHAGQITSQVDRFIRSTWCQSFE